jgi:hypothetical protein
VTDREDLGERRAILGKQGKKCGGHGGTTWAANDLLSAAAKKAWPVSGIESET